ncbi:chemotaxis protein CheA [Geothrix sp. PMB-07]|uniref:chemotaxis protein CheA n=1 Tax=Geothrix sp. PMB-07 TaxID=3068640 RepID=UPI0027419CCC|nr:chemotaxis protein CheA [Geothrix sp. PMB-07]WLT30727.1 chemotaxis protein CheA [Geothrix sp. PMB-07]
MSDFALDDPSFYEDFLVEAQEHFEQIETNFLALEESPGDLDLLNAIFRSVHTIKGAAGFLGLQKVLSLAHIGENVLDDLRKSRMELTERVMELLFETVDMLKVLVDDVRVQVRKQGEAEDPDPSELIRNLEALKKGGEASVETSGAAVTGHLNLPPALGRVNEAGRQAAAAALAEGKTVLGIHVELAGAIYGTAFNPFSMFQMVELVGKLLHKQMIPREPQVDLESFEDRAFHLDLVMLIEATEPIEEVRKVFGAVANATITFHPLTLEAASESAAAGEGAGDGLPVAEDRRKSGRRGEDKGASDTIRVSQAKLEQFMNIVAELIISKTMISHLVERLMPQVNGHPAAAVAKELAHASVYLDHVSKEIQASVLGIRMVPVKTIFSKFPRMLRDLAKNSGKKIDLQMVGEDTEIDKSIIEELGDPMIHLIRNSADHGIELPEARVKSGKSEVGTVILRARHEGDSVVVEIEDDGKGIDPTVIRAKAVEKGLMSQDRADAMPDDEVIELIFAPGFSTAAKVTDISGRGVGMDVVRSNVRKLNGRVGVRSTVGKGSVFTIKLPLTLAIIDALLVKSGNQVFALPGTSVEETLIVPPESVSHLTSRQAINLRGEVLGVCRLKHLLKSASPDNAADEIDGLSVVVVSAAGRRMGIIVDSFVRRQEVVIKPLAPYLASLPGISGASIMGDGGVVLILDPAELLQLAVQEAV